MLYNIIITFNFTHFFIQGSFSIMEKIVLLDNSVVGIIDIENELADSLIGCEEEVLSFDEQGNKFKTTGKIIEVLADFDKF